MIKPFQNEPFEDFSIVKNRQEMEKALQKVEKEYGKEWDMVVDGKHIKTKTKISSRNPSNPSEIIGYAQDASINICSSAIESAAKKFGDWRNTSVEKRSDYLFKASKLMREQKMELAATMVLEVGKNWLEAIADVSEAIDFLEFYGREMMRLEKPYHLTPYAGEKNIYKYIPLGVGVVIAPWNFPLAILAGMACAPIVTGNTVVLKPSSLSPVIGAKFMRIMEDVGLPEGVLNFITGSGSSVGNFLVDHPQTRFINFTGSKDVGLQIAERAARRMPDQQWIKRVAAEMGGKNAIIVDSSANIEAAVEGITLSAFGFQGQKCSACSRIIILKDVYKEVVEKLMHRVKKITIGPVKNYANFMGPVIDDCACEKILGYISIGKKEGKLLSGGKRLDMPGYFIEPTVFTDIKPDDRLANEEIFGPVVSILKADNFGEALDIANSTPYGLTGGIFSGNKENIQKVQRDFNVGNLYINRKITGALVDVQPFGGYNMSGTCAKAGGPDYLGLFLQGKSIAKRLNI